MNFASKNISLQTNLLAVIQNLEINCLLLKANILILKLKQTIINECLTLKICNHQKK